MDSKSSETKKGKITRYRYHVYKKRKGIKLHACITNDGFLVGLIILQGVEYNSKKFFELIESIKINTRSRPRTRPDEVLANSAFDTLDIRGYLKSRLIKNNIQVNPGIQKRRSLGRPARFEPRFYHKRTTIERLFAWLKMRFRKVNNRYERLDSVFKGLLNIACFMLCWNKV
ncbi:transposase [Methanohalobium evestigatum]|uniref:transposase n=1 Tax=Methanohalobium evestigatum TaxID=2322 RepID=UPI0009FFB480|nr:transposase [Methanohalobium evestigatum]